MRRIIVPTLVACALGVSAVGAHAATVNAPQVRHPRVDLSSPVDFSVTADWSAMLGTIVDGETVNCKDGSSTYATTADVIDASSGIGSTLVKRIRLLNSVTMSCSPQLAIADVSKTLSGTITSEAIGLTNGSFSLSCLFKANLAVTATVTVGLKVPGLAAIDVTSASPLPVACSFVGSGTVDGQRTTIVGTVEGFAKVGDAASSTCIEGVSACVPFSLDGAVVTITEATGALDGYVGTGTYSYGDSFQLSDVVSAANTLKKRYAPSAVSSQSVATPAAMRLNFQQGAGLVSILRPAPANALARGILNPSTPVVIAAPRGASCTVQLKNGTKKWVSSPSKTGLNGKVSFAFTRTSLSSVASKIGVVLKSKPAVDLAATCSDGSTKLTPKTEKIKLSL